MLGSSLALFASLPIFAQESFSCENAKQILDFVQSQHLRLQSHNLGELSSLTQNAVDHIDDQLREQGFFVLASQFEKLKLPNLKSKNFKAPNEVCAYLDSAIAREAFVKSFVSQLDPFSSFSVSEEVERKTSVVTGHFVGVGIGTDVEPNDIRITEVVEAGPADQKLKVGDKITHIDGHPVKGMDQSELRRRIRGELDTWVIFKGLRNENQAFEIAIKRGHVFQKSVSHVWKENGILQIKIHRFFAQTAEMVDRLIKTNKSRIKGIILDLRDNPGGLLQAARDVVDLFINQGVVVYLRGSYNDEIWALNPGGYTDIPLVVLVNERTASAAEIVAGALQDYKRAPVVGQKTFGKSCVQNIYETQQVLNTTYQASLRLTTLWYYLPGGRSVRKFKPDYLIPDPSGTDVERLEMPYRQPDQIQVLPMPSDDHSDFTRMLRKTAPSIALQPDRSEEIGRALIQEMQASRE